MNRKLYAWGLMVLLAAGTALTALAEDKKPPADKPATPTKPAAAGPLCPVMNEPIDVSFSIATDDGPVFFCCPDCIKKYKEAPEKFAEKVAAQRKAMADLPKVQVTCPLTGKPIDAKMFTEKDGKKVYFCCPACKPKYEADAAKLAGKLACCYTYQTKCPLCGMDINPTASLELADGRKLYFCAKECAENFAKNPAKYLSNLEKQSVHVKATDVEPKK
jgi:YHS domain-containing protein